MSDGLIVSLGLELWVVFMFAANVDFTTRITSPFYFEALISEVDEDGVLVGPIDFSDKDVRMHVRDSAYASQIVLELSIANGRLIPMVPGSGVEANLAVSVPPFALRGISARTYLYDMRYWNGPVLMYGKLIFLQGVTR